MAITVGAEPGGCVVDVEATEAIEADPRVDLGDRRVEGGRVVTSTPEPTSDRSRGRPRAVDDGRGVEDRGQLVRRAPDRAAVPAEFSRRSQR